jgi:hypothetical protein
LIKYDLIHILSISHFPLTNKFFFINASPKDRNARRAVRQLLTQNQ